MPRDLFPLTKNHFDKECSLEDLLDYFECPACYIVTDQIMECKSCNARACPQCLDGFSKEEFRKNPDMKRQQMYKCTVCLKNFKFRQCHKFLK